MMKAKKFALAIGGIALLSGCAEFAVSGAKNATPTGSAFDQALYQEYVALAELELGERDFTDAIFFANRAETAAGAVMITPQMVGDRAVPAATTGELGVARDVLMARFAQGAKTDIPGPTARMQAAYECWLQEQEENLQPEDIEACKERFLLASEEVAAYYRTPVAAAPAPAPAPVPAPETEMETIDIFFAFDSSELSSGAFDIVRNAAATAQAEGVKAILVEGFTDTKGSSAYNERLAKMRAETVAKALAAAGFPADMIEVSSYGESRPQVATGDEVEHLSNRIVTLDFLK